MHEVFVNRASIAVSSESSTMITAKSLGSTLAVVATDPGARVAGIAQCVLPVTQGRQSKLPGVLEQMRDLFKHMIQKGASAQDMKIMLFGAATFIHEPKELALGVELYKRAVQALKKNGLILGGEHVGGPLNRSVSIEVGSPRARVILADKKEIFV